MKSTNTFLTNLKKRSTYDDKNKPSSQSSYYYKTNSNSNTKNDDLFDDIEDTDDRPHKVLKTTHSTTLSTSSSPPSLVYQKNNSSGGSNNTNNNNNNNNRIISKSSNKVSSQQTSPRNSQSNGSQPFSSSSKNTIDLDEDDGLKLKCICGESCTDKSEYHLKNYYHSKKIDNKAPNSKPQPIPPTINNNNNSKNDSKSSVVPDKEEPLMLDETDENDSSLDDILSFSVNPNKKKITSSVTTTKVSASDNNIKKSTDNLDIDMNNSDSANNRSFDEDLIIVKRNKPLKNTNIIDVPELDVNLLTKQEPSTKVKNKQKQKQQQQQQQQQEQTSDNFKISSLRIASNTSPPPIQQKSTTSPFNIPKPIYSSNNNSDDKGKIWLDKYIPKTEDELITNNKKQNEVKLWLEYRFKEINENTPITEKLLILTGPSGIGKSTLIRVLSNTMGFDINEWVNPPMVITKDLNGQLTTPYQPQIQDFKNWIKFSSRGGSLFSKSKLSVLLIEEYPHIIETAQNEFKRIFFEYLECGLNPLVFIISDSSNGNSPLYQILPPSMLTRNTVKHINFNSIPPGTHLRLLKKISAAEGFSNIPAQQLEAIAQDSAGDIRASINSLEFFCIGRKHVPPPPKQKISKKSKSSSDQNNNQITHTNDDIDQIKHRNPTLTMFHSLGKILYNKRIHDVSYQYNDKLWYKEQYHRYPLENPETEKVFESSYAAFQPFMNFVHENFLSFYQSIDEVSSSLDYLSDSDLLVKSEGTEFFRISGSRSYNEGASGGSHDYLPQCSISIALRGVAYTHTLSNSRSFYGFLKPRLQQYNDQAIALYDDINNTIQNNFLSLSLNGYRAIPLSLLPTKEFYLQILPYIQLINFYLIKQPQRFNNSLILSLMKNSDMKRLLERLCKFSNDSYYKYSNNQENQIKESFSSVVIDEESNEEIQNLQKTDDNNKLKDTSLTNKLGNNEILEDDIEELPD